MKFAKIIETEETQLLVQKVILEEGPALMFSWVDGVEKIDSPILFENSLEGYNFMHRSFESTDETFIKVFQTIKNSLKNELPDTNNSENN